MKNLIRIVILVMLSYVLFVVVVNAQYLIADRFVKTCKTIDADDVISVDYSFRDFAFYYNDIDDFVSESGYFKIYIYIGNDSVYFCEDITKYDKLPQYTLPPVLREYFFAKLNTNPVDSIRFRKRDYNYLDGFSDGFVKTVIPDDPYFFINYYKKHFGSELVKSFTSHDIKYYAELVRPRFFRHGGSEMSYYNFFPDERK